MAAEAIVGPIVQKIVDSTINAIVREFKYLFCYKENIQNLSAKVQDLENKRSDVQESVNEAKNNALVIESQVDAWLEKVDALKKEAKDVLSRATNSKIQCLFLGCPNLKVRYSLSRKAIKKITAIDELQGEGKFDRVGHPAPLRWPSFRGSEALKTRISTKKEIIKALEDKDIHIVGICGLPGVGKTTTAKEVMTDVKDGLFDEVTMAVVSKDVNIVKIQDQLAEMLGQKIEEKTEMVRARRLHQRFTKDNRKKILVILDDLWAEIDLKTIGIPSSSEHEGLKIILTSRFDLVCKNTGAQKTIEVGALPRDEAFSLFQVAAGISSDASKVEDIAKQVAEECQGLPLALIVVGKTLRNSRLHAWKDALRQLQNSRLAEKVFSSIELSYNYLESDEHRSLLLLCSLFDEDESIPIETLVRYARGLKLFLNAGTLLQTRNRAYTIFDYLKSCHLLLPVEEEEKGEEEKVKLHDVIRDFCLGKQKHRYMVRHDFLLQWPERDDVDHKSYDAISLTSNELHVNLPNKLQYRNLKLLRVLYNGQRYCPMVFPKPAEFFDDTQELRVLHFSNIEVPSSIRLPIGLRTLCLDCCTLKFEISIFRGLKMLEILTFSGSLLHVDFHDDKTVELSNLRLLDLRFHEENPSFVGFLLGWEKLEELYLGDHFGTTNEEKEHIIKDVSLTKSLSTLQINTDDTLFLIGVLRALPFKELERFQIKRSDNNYGSFELDGFERSMQLDDIHIDMLLQPELMTLMEKSDYLSLSVKGERNIFGVLNQDGFTHLKTLNLGGSDFEYLIDATDSIPSGTFRNLEHLDLTGLNNLKAICSGNLRRRTEQLTSGVPEPALFSNLMVIVLGNCNEIKSMFPESVARGMANLQELLINECPMLEEVVSIDSQENVITVPLVFPKLKMIQLDFLERFKSFRSQSNGNGVRQTLFNQVALPNLDDLDIREVNQKILMCGEQMKSLQKLRNLHVGFCNNMSTLLDFECLVITQEWEESLFGQLRALFLYRLPKLEHIMWMVPKGIRVFQNLAQLIIQSCDNLKYLFWSSMIKSLETLESLDVTFCQEMEEIFKQEEENASEIEMVEGGKASKIVFPKLRSLTLVGLKRFKTFCSKNYKLAFPSLDELTIEDCPEMKKNCWGRLNAPELKKVRIGENEYIDASNFFDKLASNHMQLDEDV